MDQCSLERPGPVAETAPGYGALLLGGTLRSNVSGEVIAPMLQWIPTSVNRLLLIPSGVIRSGKSSIAEGALALRKAGEEAAARGRQERPTRPHLSRVLFRTRRGRGIRQRHGKRDNRDAVRPVRGYRHGNLYRDGLPAEF